MSASFESSVNYERTFRSDGPIPGFTRSGNTINDMVIGPDCNSLQLRSEREAEGDGRVYTITFRVTDQAGNYTTPTARVYVPKSGDGQPAIDSGVNYTGR